MSTTDLTPELLLQAYAAGIFPMAENRDDADVFWVDPQERGIFPLDGFHISRSLARRLKQGGYEISVDQEFAAVVANCADRPETWINQTIFELYLALHDMGHAHSLEVRKDGQLVGGVYGVTLGAAFFGESMFSHATDMSKIALVYLVDRLRLNGFVLFDTQFLTPHLASLGAIEITRTTYRDKLANALRLQADFTTECDQQNVYDVIQRNTQTS